MLIEKDEELERMRTNKSNTGQNNTSPLKEGASELRHHGGAARNNQPDSGASTSQEGTMMATSFIEADNSQLIESSPRYQQEVSI